MFKRMILGAVLLGSFAVAGCSDVGGVSTPMPASSDPKKGWVLAIDSEDDTDDIFMRCVGDGTTMIFMRLYADSGITAVVNDPQCK